MTYQKHMSFAESVTETGRTNYSDGSARITYQIVASQYIDILGRSSARLQLRTLRSPHGRPVAYTDRTRVFNPPGDA